MTEPTFITQTSNLDKFTYLAPFVGMGAAGGAIRAMNTKNFTWKNLIIRAITGGFGASLAGLYLRHTPYAIEAQFAIAGAVGAMSCELIQAAQTWLMNKATNQGGIGGYDPLNPHPFDTQYPDITDNLPVPVEQPQEPQDCEPDTADTDKTATGN